MAFALTWVLFALLGDSWWQLFTAALLAVLYTQVAFLGHDAGHKQIFPGRRRNDAVGIGLAGGLYMGCSFAPNHKGMLTLSEGHHLDFLRKQISPRTT